MVRVFLLMIVCLLSACQGFAEETPPCLADRDTLLSMDYTSFDQDLEGGWRAIAAREECRLAAAELLHAYHARLREKGEPVVWQTDQGAVTLSEDGAVHILYWHEGQLRALSGQYGRAAALFRRSLKPEGENYRGWNQYALGSIAFLEGDIGMLRENREALSAAFPDSINLRVLDRLITCFGEPYAKAYVSTACEPG